MTPEPRHGHNPQKPLAVTPELTPCERGVLKLVALGHSTATIVETLCISVRTVDAHRRNLGEKLGTTKPALLRGHAVRLGLVAGNINIL